MLRVDVRKNSITAVSSNDGELETSMTTSAPANASASPSPVIVLTPVLRSAATGSWPCSPSFATSLEPRRPLPPMTTIFMAVPFGCVESVAVQRRSEDGDRLGDGRARGAGLAQRVEHHE